MSANWPQENDRIEMSHPQITYISERNTRICKQAVSIYYHEPAGRGKKSSDKDFVFKDQTLRN